uniref:Uncharacterized protein n=1 Tax=Arundo donax TaxID=35708 RepID=A0A0A8Y1X5_ARUDO
MSLLYLPVSPSPRSRTHHISGYAFPASSRTLQRATSRCRHLARSPTTHRWSVEGADGALEPAAGSCVLEGIAKLRSSSDLAVVVEIWTPLISFPHSCLHLGACRYHAAISDRRPRPPLPRAVNSRIRRKPRGLLSPARGMTAMLHIAQE